MIDGGTAASCYNEAYGKTTPAPIAYISPSIPPIASQTTTGKGAGTASQTSKDKFKDAPDLKFGGSPTPAPSAEKDCDGLRGYNYLRCTLQDSLEGIKTFITGAKPSVAPTQIPASFGSLTNPQILERNQALKECGSDKACQVEVNRRFTSLTQAPAPATTFSNTTQTTASTPPTSGDKPAGPASTSTTAPVAATTTSTGSTSTTASLIPKGYTDPGQAGDKAWGDCKKSGKSDLDCRGAAEKAHSAAKAKLPDKVRNSVEYRNAETLGAVVDEASKTMLAEALKAAGAKDSKGFSAAASANIQAMQKYLIVHLQSDAGINMTPAERLRYTEQFSKIVGAGAGTTTEAIIAEIASAGLLTVKGETARTAAQTAAPAPTVYKDSNALVKAGQKTPVTPDQCGWCGGGTGQGYCPKECGGGDKSCDTGFKLDANKTSCVVDPSYVPTPTFGNRFGVHHNH